MLVVRIMTLQMTLLVMTQNTLARGKAKLNKSTKKAAVEPECAGRGEDARQIGSNSRTKSKKRGIPPILAAESARHVADAPVERRQPQLEEIETGPKPYVLEVLQAWESVHWQV